MEYPGKVDGDAGVHSLASARLSRQALQYPIVSFQKRKTTTASWARYGKLEDFAFGSWGHAEGSRSTLEEKLMERRDAQQRATAIALEIPRCRRINLDKMPALANDDKPYAPSHIAAAARCITGWRGWRVHMPMTVTPKTFPSPGKPEIPQEHTKETKPSLRLSPLATLPDLARYGVIDIALGLIINCHFCYLELAQAPDMLIFGSGEPYDSTAAEY
ncbi:hypothetical protein V8C37DRAFT_406017 [Trichoderma ceciliae]